jgi:hypothetical protein
MGAVWPLGRFDAEGAEDSAKNSGLAAEDRDGARHTAALRGEVLGLCWSGTCRVEGPRSNLRTQVIADSVEIGTIRAATF